MRTNNSKVRNVIISVYFILVVLAVLLATIFSIFKGITNNGFETFIIITFIFGSLFFLVHAASKYFEYDSDGVKVVVTNKGLLLSDYLNYREHSIDFDKSALVGFKFTNYFIYKNLILYIKNSKGHTHKERFNITLVSKKKRRYIKQSLTKMVKQNKKETSINNI